MTIDQIIKNKEHTLEEEMQIRSGSIPGPGIYSCINCSVNWLLNDYEELPDCPECGGTDFIKK